MGILQSKAVKQKEKHPFSKKTKNGTTEKAAAKTAMDLKVTNYLTGNPNNTANTSVGLSPTEIIINHMEPRSDDEAMFTRKHQVSAAHVPENREESGQKAMNISQNAHLLKHVPYLPLNVSKNKTAETFEALSDILQQLYDVCEKINQQNLRPPRQLPQMTKPTAPVQQQTKPEQEQKKATVLIQQQANRQEIHIQPEDSRNFTPSQQKPTTRDPIEITPHKSEVPTSTQMFCKDSLPQAEYRVIVRPTGKVPTNEADAEAKAKLTKLSSQKSNCGLFKVKKPSTDLIRHKTDETHNILQQSTITKPDVAELPATNSTGLADHSTQMPNQPKAQFSDEENAQQKFCLNRNNVTNEITVACFSYKSKKKHGSTAKMRIRQKLAKKLKARRAEARNGIQQAVEDPVTTVPESSHQQGYRAVEDKRVKKHSGLYLITQPNQADYGNTFSCIQTVSVKAEAHVPMVEGRPVAVLNDANTQKPATAADTDVKVGVQCEPKVPLPQVTAVRPKTKRTPKDLHLNEAKKNPGMFTTKEITGKNGQDKEVQQEQAVTPPVIPEREVCAKVRWPQFTINQSCSHKAHCKHNPGKGLLPNVNKWTDEGPKCEPPWVTTARLAACLALRGMQDEREESQA